MLFRSDAFLDASRDVPETTTPASLPTPRATAEQAADLRRDLEATGWGVDSMHHLTLSKVKENSRLASANGRYRWRGVTEKLKKNAMCGPLYVFACKRLQIYRDEWIQAVPAKTRLAAGSRTNPRWLPPRRQAHRFHGRGP